MFSCEYCEIFRNTYFEANLRTAASVVEKVENCWHTQNFWSLPGNSSFSFSDTCIFLQEWQSCRVNNYLILPEDEKMFTDGQKVKAREDSYATESLASSETKNSFWNSSSRKRRKFLAEEKPDDENSLALPACLQRGSSPTIVKETQLFKQEIYRPVNPDRENGSAK